MTFRGPERREDERLKAEKLGRWLIERGILLAGALFLVFAIQAVLTYGIIQVNHRSQQQLSRMESLLEHTKTQADLAKGLAASLREFEVAHARATAGSHEAINHNLRCILLIRPENRTPENVDACLKMTVPAPSPVPVPRETGRP